VTTIDAASTAKRGFEIYASGCVDGFTITGGHAWGIPPNQGGGVWIEDCSATVANCTFQGNYCEYYGGAIATLWAHGATITDCAFVENRTEYYGGAIYNYDSDLTITGCVFTDNVALATPDDVDEDDPIPGGGAIFNEEGQPTISDCILSGNSGYYGSGISNYFSDAYVVGCTISDGDEFTIAGGGMYNYGGSPMIEGCLFRGNSVTWSGGAVFEVSTGTYVNCIMCDNAAYSHGGAVYINRSTDDATSRPNFVNCTLYGNDAVKGGGLYSDNTIPTMTNCIVWGNTAISDIDGPGIFDSKSVWSGAGIVATYCDIQGASTFSGTGNLRVDPGFVVPGSGDFSLPFGSPCIDVGNNSAAPLPTVDFIGNPRVRDGDEDGTATVDMGAFEFRGRAVSDYLYAARIFETMAYDDPNDADPEHIFLVEFETGSEVDHIEFETPAGHTYTIPSDALTSNGGVQTYHQVVNGTHVWGYRVEVGPSNPITDYGDGLYEVTLYYMSENPHETDLWYGIPDTSTALAMPSQVPNITSPSYGGAAVSPTTFSWEACTDGSANHVSVTIIDGADEPVLTDIIDADMTTSNEYALAEGQYSAEVAFEHSYEVTNAQNIPFEYGKTVLVGHEFEVVISTVYRFWSPTLSRHFYTISAAERDGVIALYSSHWSYEGPAFLLYATDCVEGLKPVYRFWSPTLLAHFYTINEAEKDTVIAEYSHAWTYEGVAFYAFSPNETVPPDAKPVYRFWNETSGTHFYTINEAEKDTVIAEYSYAWYYEGIAFYAFEQ
jgi:predicted outer membrane repeat protein